MNWDEEAKWPAAAAAISDRPSGLTFLEGARRQREMIRECFKNHPDPRCEEHPNGDLISCGWKSAYISLLNYLEES